MDTFPPQDKSSFDIVALATLGISSSAQAITEIVTKCKRGVLSNWFCMKLCWHTQTSYDLLHCIAKSDCKTANLQRNFWDIRIVESFSITDFALLLSSCCTNTKVSMKCLQADYCWTYQRWICHEIICAM